MKPTDPLIVMVENSHIIGWESEADGAWATIVSKTEIIDEEEAVFNGLSDDGQLMHTDLDNGAWWGTVDFRSPPPYSREFLAGVLRLFLDARRMLVQPTQAEAVDLLAHKCRALTS
jgi:hypothetical protein